MNFRGVWSAGSGYAANDAVTFGGSTYLAGASNSALQPDLAPQTWAVLAQAGSAGPSGASGTAATVSIGAVVTGAPGSEALVTNSGTGLAAVLNFTIPQGATGASGGGGGTGTGGISGAGVHHTVWYGSTNYFLYYSVSNSTSSPSEPGALTAPYSVLTWVPNGCKATALNVYSQQNGSITVTLRVGNNPPTMIDTALVCSSIVKGSSCSATSSTLTIPPGSFVDLRIDGADANPAAVWTALACS
jgi:hypothetical protein